MYVDGFNLYYGALKGTPFKWLNLERFCALMLPRNDIQRINFYTAMVSARPENPDQPQRQFAYLRALGTLPMVHVHFGHYLTHAVWMRLETPPATGSSYVRVLRSEEKGSDVNLATHLVSDAYEDHFDTAVVVTNDSDLREPVDLVTRRLGKRVGVLNPQKHPAVVLAQAATFFKTIRRGVLQATQFPEQINSANGAILRPAGW